MTPGPASLSVGSVNELIYVSLFMCLPLFRVIDGFGVLFCYSKEFVFLFLF